MLLLSLYLKALRAAFNKSVINYGSHNSGYKDLKFYQFWVKRFSYSPFEGQLIGDLTGEICKKLTDWSIREQS